MKQQSIIISASMQSLIDSKNTKSKVLTIEDILEIAKAESKNKNYKKAVEYLDQAIARDSNCYAAYIEKSYSLKELFIKNKNLKNSQSARKYFKYAKESLEKAIEIKPQDFNAYGFMGSLLRDKFFGNIEESIKFFDKAINLNPYSYKLDSYYFGKSNCFQVLGMHKEAIECFDKIKYPDKLIYRSKGFSLNFLGRYDEAVKCADKAINIDSKYCYAYRIKAFALEKLGCLYEASESYKKLVELSGDYDNKYKNKISQITKTEESYKNGIQFGKNGNINEAIKCFDIAIKMNPEYLPSYTFKAFALEHINKLNDAESLYDHVLRLDPNNKEAQLKKDNLISKMSNQNCSNPSNLPQQKDSEYLADEIYTDINKIGDFRIENSDFSFG